MFLHHFSFYDFLNVVNTYADTFSLLIVIVLFMVERYNSRESRRKDSLMNWYLSFVIEKNIKFLDDFFINIENDIVNKVPLLELNFENSDSLTNQKIRFVSIFDKNRRVVSNNLFLLISNLNSGLYNSCLAILDDVEDTVKVYVDSNIGVENCEEFDLENLYTKKAKIYDLLYKPLENLV